MKNATSTPALQTDDFEENLALRPFEAAFEELREEVDAYPEKKLVAINLDVRSVVFQVLGIAPNILQFREVAVATRGVDVRKIDKLATYAGALAYAHTKWLSLSEPRGPVPALIDELTQIRSLLISDVSALGKRGFMDASKLQSLRGPQKAGWLMDDVALLVTLLRTHWDAVAHRTGVTMTNLDHADRLVIDLALSYTSRKKRSSESLAWELARQKTFSMLLDAYFEARRFILFHRAYQRDADKIAPSLYAGRPYGRKKTDKVVTFAQPFAPSASQEGEVPVTPTIQISEQGKLVSRPKAAPGMPGDEPFDGPVH